MLQVNQIHFSYQQKETLKDISFKIDSGEHVAIIGESGCGKSTLLKVVYGLLDLDKGEIYWDGEKVLGPAFHLIPGHRKMKYLPQEFELMPYISVRQNIEKFLSRQHPQYNKERVDELLQVIEMESFAEIHVKKLSGGQKQRVALAQILAKEAKFLLLDEPFNFIDNFRKNTLRRKLFNFLKKERITCLFATHDSKDMLGFSDRVLVMKNGAIIANQSPLHLYEQPPSYEVASLIKEVNKIESLLVGEDLKKSFLIYPHELTPTNKEGILVKVMDTYFNGSYFLIRAKSEKNNQEILFQHSSTLSKGVKLNLIFAEELKKKRKCDSLI